MASVNNIPVARNDVRAVALSNIDGNGPAAALEEGAEWEILLGAMSIQQLFETAGARQESYLKWIPLQFSLKALSLNLFSSSQSFLWNLSGCSCREASWGGPWWFGHSGCGGTSEKEPNGHRNSSQPSWRISHIGRNIRQRNLLGSYWFNRGTREHRDKWQR